MSGPVQITRGTSAQWAASSQVLADGQLGLERKPGGPLALRVGDGVTAAPGLPSFDQFHKYTSIDVVADHGADKTGVASAVSAFNAAIAAANSAGGKVVIDIPPGSYNLTASGTTAISQGNVYLRGAGRGVTTLKGGSGSMFTWGSGLDGGGLSDVTISYTSPDSASRVISADDGHRLLFHRLTLNKVRQLARLGATSGCNRIVFRDVYGYTDPTTGSIVIDACNGADLVLDNVSAFPLGIAAPTGTNAHPGTDLTFLRFGQGSWDTVHARGVITNRFGRGVDISASGAVAVINMWFTDCVFDYNKYHGIRISSASGANVGQLFFNSGYVVASDGYGVEITGAANIRHVHFTDVITSQSGKNNWRMVGSAMDEVTLTNCMGMGANRLTGNTGSDQDDLVLLGSGVSVKGGMYGESGAPYGLSGQGRYGLQVAANLDVYSITGVQATGATDNYIIPATNTAGSYRRLVTGNRASTNVLPQYAFTATVTAPTSAATQTHTASTLDTLYIYGGTVTVITHNGTQVGTTGPATLNLRPGDTWAITYSAAPTIKRVVQA